MQRVVPYTTRSGIRIGCMYQPKVNYVVSRDMERLQTALIGKPISGIMNRIGFLISRWSHYD